MPRAALTLIELLMAVTLLATLTVTVSGISLQAAQYLSRARTAHEREQAASLAWRVLTGDVMQRSVAGIGFGNDGGQLEFTTLHRLPGEPPLLRAVVWNIENGNLGRMASTVGTETTTDHHVFGGLSAIRFHLDGERNLWLQTGDGNHRLIASDVQ